MQQKTFALKKENQKLVWVDGPVLKLILNRRRIRITDLAPLLGVSDSHLSRVCTGRRPLDKKTFGLLEKFVGLDLGVVILREVGDE